MRHLNLRNIFWLTILGTLIATFSQSTLAQIMDSSTAPQAPGAPGPATGQGQAAAAAGPPSICGNQQLCQEGVDFAATITSFRISTDSYNHRIMDATVRFQNKTNQPLVLGYVNQSGIATDDRGNRSVPWGPNAYRGIGLVAGSNFDPKFIVRAGGWGDAQFELVQQGWPQVVGFNYVLDLTVAEINTFEGNQHTLGGEFPLHFQGLANGSGAASPNFAAGSAIGSGSAAAFGSSGGTGSAASAMSNPCAAAGALGQGAGQATSTVATAANAISSLGSMFHHKKSQDAGQAAANAVGCAPNGAAPAVMPMPAAERQAVPTAVATKAAQVTPVKPITNAVTPATATAPAQGAVVNAATRTAVTAPPAASARWASATTQKPNPTPAAKPAPATAAAKPAPAKPNTNAKEQARKQNTAVEQK